MYKLFLIIIAATSLSISSPVEAAKKFIPKKNLVRRTVSSGIPALVRYRGDKLGLFMSFPSFRSLQSVSYSFTYEASGIPQGVGGTITSANNPAAERELLFGTCSSSVCTYHHNLTNARLVLTAKMTNGKTLTKTYRIKTYQ